LGGFVFVISEDEKNLVFDKIMTQGEEKSVKPVRIPKGRLLAYGTYAQYKKVKKMMEDFTQELTVIDTEHKEISNAENVRYAKAALEVRERYTREIEKIVSSHQKKTKKH
jgi:hypothetical protein